MLDASRLADSGKASNVVHALADSFVRDFNRDEYHYVDGGIYTVRWDGENYIAASKWHLYQRLRRWIRDEADPELVAQFRNNHHGRLALRSRVIQRIAVTDASLLPGPIAPELLGWLRPADGGAEL